VAQAIELEDGRWALGVQWHPEAGDRRELFAAFVEAAALRAPLNCSD
jgi:gamma-glutamyl-gamma-aminobutyrate hydrolase PuuD